jgi:hypothetical protein
MLRTFRLQTRRCMLHTAISFILIPWVVAALPGKLSATDINLPPGAHVLSRDPGAFGMLPRHMSRQSSAETRKESFNSSSSKPQHVRTILARQDTPAQPPEVGPRLEAAAAEELANAKDPTQRDKWDANPSYSSHYSSDEERPNMCRISHQVPAPHGRQQYNFTAEQKDYVPYVGTSLTRDSQLMLLRQFYRCSHCSGSRMDSFDVRACCSARGCAMHLCCCLCLLVCAVEPACILHLLVCRGLLSDCCVQPFAVVNVCLSASGFLNHPHALTAAPAVCAVSAQH